MGFFSSISRGWGFIKEAFAMAKQDRTLLKPSVYSIVAGITYWMIFVGVVIGADINFDSTGGKMVGAFATFGSFVIFYFFMGMTVHLVDVHLKGGTPTLREAYADAKQNFGAILVLALVSTIVELITKAVRRSAGNSESAGIGILLSIIASVIESVWSMLSFLLLPAIIIEDVSLGQALTRVREISKGNYMQIGVGDVGVRMVTGLIGVVVILVLYGVVHVSFSMVGGTAGTVMGIGVGGTILCLYCAFASYLRMAYYTCLYLWAADKVDKGPNAPAPLPLARVLNQ